METDVCVIGAGYAGLTAALRVAQGGRSVTVLEARDRIGGRVYTDQLADGTPVDLGAAWYGHRQDRAFALAAEMGAETYRTYEEGENVLVTRGKPNRYTGTVPRTINPLQLASLAVAMKRLDRMAAQVPLDAPWDAPKASRWDASSLDAWLRHNVPRGIGHDLLRFTLSDLYTADLAEVSLLYALFLINSHGGFERLTSIEGGNQQDRIVGGAQRVLDRIVEALDDDAVRLSSPATGLYLRNGGVEVVSDGATVHARKAIVAVPPAITGTIRFDPPLPSDRAMLTQRMAAGPVVKIGVAYDEAWWRTDGLSGVSIDVSSPVGLTFDLCGPTVPPGILMALVAGPPAQAFTRLGATERRQTVVDALAHRFGPKARAVAEYHERDWGADPWSRGGYVAHLAPGGLTSFGRALRTPVGPIHWAGTETEAVSHGAMDGAIRSGERAAAEALAGIAERAVVPA